MATTKTVENIISDSTLSIMERTAARAINLSRKNNGHINLAKAAAIMEQDVSIGNAEATEYVTMVSSHADDIEWNRRQP